MTSPATPATDRDAWLTAPLRGRPDIEVLQGMDDRRLLYDPRQREYHSISAAGATVFSLLDGRRTGRELAALAGRAGSESADPEAEVVRFLTALRDAGLLEAVSAAPRPDAPALDQAVSRDPLLRLPLCRSLPRILAPACRVADRMPAWLGALGMIAAAFLVAAGLAALPHVGPAWPGTVWWLLPLQIAQVVMHELAHAFACQLYGVPVREAGIGLLLYVVPVAYVDRTDAYRLTLRRQRVLVALAGPLSDFLWTAGYAGLSLAATGDLAVLGRWGLVFGLVLIVANLNPLLPTDGFRALEAACGSLDLRGRSLRFLFDRLRNQPPAAAHGVGGWRTGLYLTLATLWLVYLIATVLLAVFQVSSLISGGHR